MAVELLIRVVIAALASYRVARMLAEETGPFALFSRFRGWVFIWQGKRHGPKAKTWITEGVECPLCTGFYASLVMLGLTYVDFVAYAVVWLAVAGLQTALQRLEGEKEMKLKYTGQAQAPVTFAGKFTVSPGDVIDAEEPDTNVLLQSGFFQAVNDDFPPPASGGEGSKKSSSSTDDDDGKGSSSKKS